MTTDLGVAAKISSSGEQLVRNPDLIPIQARGECPFFFGRDGSFLKVVQKAVFEGSSLFVRIYRTYILPDFIRNIISI